MHPDGSRARHGDGPVDKRALRTRLLAARRARSAAQLESARAAIRAAVLAEQALRGWSCVAGYEPLRTEPGSTELLDGLARAGVRVLVPVLREDRDLDWADWIPGSGRSPDLAGLRAVAAADAVLVPALAVAADGTRLGRGGGSYDRALPRVRAGVAVAALLFADERVPELPRDAWDAPVSAVVTPEGWQECGGQPPGFGSRAARVPEAPSGGP